MARSAKTNRTLIILFVTFGSLTYGYSASIIATTLAQPSFVDKFLNVPNAASLEGGVNGVFQAAGLIGALMTSATADFFGRKRALFIGATFAWVGGALQAGSVHIAMFFVGRLLTGLGIGKISSQKD